MRAWNRNKKPKHTTKMKWVWIIDDMLDDNWLYEKVVKYYSKSRCTKRISEHNELDYSEIKRDRFSMKNYNDMKMWNGY